MTEQGTGNMEQAGTPDQGFKKLLAWQKADDLLSEVYRLTEQEIDGRHRWLSLQIVRAAFSVTSNIAEGYGRSSLGDYARFVELAGASLNEVEDALHFIKRNGVLPVGATVKAEELRWATGNLLFGLLRSLRARLKAGGPWQRGLLREEGVEYGSGDWDLSMFQVPSSDFEDAEEHYA